MTRALRRLALLLLLLAVAAGGAAADPAEPTMDRPLANPAQESHARALMREIRCVVCQSQSIDESDAEIAAQLRNVIREQLAAGRSDGEIRDYLVSRYGDFVLLDPPFKATTLILWLGPFLLAGLGFAGAVGILRRRPTATQHPAGAAAGESAMTPRDLDDRERRRLAELLVEGGDEARPTNPAGTGA